MWVFSTSDEFNAKRKLRILIKEVSVQFGEEYIRVLEFHVKSRFREDIWSSLIEHPKRTLDILARLFGSEKVATYMLREIFTYID